MVVETHSVVVGECPTRPATVPPHASQGYRSRINKLVSRFFVNDFAAMKFRLITGECNPLSDTFLHPFSEAVSINYLL